VIVRSCYNYNRNKDHSAEKHRKELITPPSECR